MIDKIISWWKKSWEYIPPRESDVVYLKIVRKCPDGKLSHHILDGDDANQWGWLILNYTHYNHHPKAKHGYRDLNWKKYIVS